MSLGFLVLDSGEVFSGQWLGGEPKAGEVVFNTSHSGYEEIATDPSYYSQIMVMTAPQQGNYGVDDGVWESKDIWIQGLLCLEMQNSTRDKSWVERLTQKGVPVVEGMDTRSLVLCLREKGTPWGAVVKASTKKEAQDQASVLIQAQKKMDSDWVHAVTCKEPYELKGDRPSGAKVAVLDFGLKKNILRELKKRSSQIKVFPSRTSAKEILSWDPHGVMLTNGPGNPVEVLEATETVRELLGHRFIFGICMGHQILSQSLGASTYKLKFGHRGSNQPVKDHNLDLIYMTSQNHGYAVDKKSLPENVTVSHTHLNDQTVSGIMCLEKKCMSVQFHPESHPGPRDAEGLFDYFIKQIQ